MQFQDEPLPDVHPKEPPTRRLRELNEQLTLATLRAHEEADVSASRYRALVEGLDAIVWEADADPWKITFVSERAHTLLGYPIERWYAEPTFWIDVIHPEDREEAFRICRSAAATPTDFRLEYRAIAADGRIVYLAMIARPELHAPTSKHFRGLLIDVGDTVRAEALQKLVTQQTQELLVTQDHLRALASELNLAEHRVRTKLAVELHDHLAQMLALGRLKLGQARQVKRVPKDCLKHIEQTEDVLTQSLSYTRTLVADLSPPVLHEFGLPAALDWLSRQMRRYDLIVEVELADMLNLPISEEQAVLLFQSVRELLINTAKHAKTSHATVALQADDARLRITVRDKGCGFDFPGCGAPAATSPKFGLFSIRERMKALGGDFEMTSVRGMGSTAILTLPLAGVSGEESMDATSSSAVSQHQSLSPYESDHVREQSDEDIQIFLADDHAMIRQGLRMVVNAYPHMHVVGEASNGLEAVEGVRHLHPDVVIMDISMPQMDGIEAAKRIKEEFPDMAVIGLSMHEAHDIGHSVNQVGMCKLVAKESAADTLCQAIEEAASQRRQR